MDAVRQILFPPTPERGGIRASVVIDAMKGLTPVYILYMIFSHNATQNTTAWVYFGTAGLITILRRLITGVHGCYGLLWVAKTLTGFGDERWKRPVPWWNALLTLVGLALYWMPIGIIVKRPAGQEAPAWLLGVSVMLFGLGVFWHFTSGASLWFQRHLFMGRYAKDHVLGASRAHEEDLRRASGCRGVSARVDGQAVGLFA